ncbi:MAG: hypothetical protein A3J74_04055 [Elusimicrobia bacterium RIFCSPHIGHO2_02_FULL_57_9]|nr:MAG: hypothetical protein A3J74_04055 [Elusimicrobia bacterium RIFCSPHIGHO2_02_FULL_57_9]
MAKLKDSILLCAATRWEFDPLAKRLGNAVTLLKTGVGPKRTAAALARLEAQRFAYVISTGLCGALQPGMKTGDLMIDIQGADLDLAQAAREIAGSLNVPIHFGKIAHSDRVASTFQEKAALGRRQRAGAVDMETSAIREWATRHKAQPLAIRAILDAMEDPLPGALPDGDGDFSDDIKGTALFILKNIISWKMLAGLALKQRKAMANLSAFLEKFLEKI